MLPDRRSALRWQCQDAPAAAWLRLPTPQPTGEAVQVYSGVAAGVSPAVEPSILPGGTSSRILQMSPGIFSSPNDRAFFPAAGCRPLRQPGLPPLRRGLPSTAVPLLFGTVIKS